MPSYTRRNLEMDVLTAARARIADVFDRREKICISFSGGKDSGVLLHLVMDEAIKRGRRVTVLFLDWEAQYDLTIRFVRECMDLYAEHIDPLWVCVPLKTVNACSVHEPEWTCWEPAKRGFLNPGFFHHMIMLFFCLKGVQRTSLSSRLPLCRR